jgi:hypothetical protein
VYFSDFAFNGTRKIRIFAFCLTSVRQQKLYENKENDYMGFSFNFFGTQEVRKFNYRPRFYDPEKEERRRKFGDHSKEAEGKPYVPGQHIKGSLRDGNYSRTEEIGKNQKVVGIITTFLLFAVIFLIVKYYPILLEALSK